MIPINRRGGDMDAGPDTEAVIVPSRRFDMLRDGDSAFVAFVRVLRMGALEEGDRKGAGLDQSLCSMAQA